MSKVHCIIFLSVLCGSFINQVTAQSSINSTEFIQQYLAVVNTSKGTTSFTNDFKTAWLEELEFRTRTRDFDIDQQRYTLRFKPTTKKIRTAQRNLSNLLTEEFLLKKADFGNSLLVLAYKDWLDLVMLKKKIAIHNDLLVIYGDIENVLLKLSQYEELNIKDFLEVKSAITDSNIAIQTSEKTIADYIAESQISDVDLLSIEALKAALIQEELSSPATVPNQQELNKNAIVEAEIALEKAEQKQLFDFFQVQYDGPHTDQLQERISLGTSINLPISSKRNLKMQELELEQLLLSEEMLTDRILKREKISRKKIKLERLLDNYILTKEQLGLQQKEAAIFLDKIAQKEGVTPLLLLRHKIKEQKEGLDLLKIESDIYTTYIDYLEVTEHLFIIPFRNFLIGE